MAVILYLDRFCVSFAERYIKEDLALSEWQISLFLSAFFAAYSLGQVPAGWWGDRSGARSVLTLYIFAWSAFTALIGMAEAFLMLLIMRLGCGLAQAGAYPVAGSLLRRWVPFGSRGRASALVALGGRIGGAIAPLLTAWLMVLFVPVGVSSQIEPQSVLRPMSLCQRLWQSSQLGQRVEPFAEFPQATPAAARVFNLLPPEARELVSRMTQGAPAPAEESAPKQKQSASPLQMKVAGFLNPLLSNPELFSEEAMGRLSLSEPAVKLLKRRGAGDHLAHDELARLNRLLLEAVFPEDLGQLFVKGWRPVLWVYGAAGLVVAAAFWFVFRDAPGQHPWCNAAEQALIGHEPAGGPPEPFPWSAVLASRSLWLSALSQFGTNLGWLFFVTYLARYLMEVHHVPILERSLMTSLPPLAGIAGMFLGGWSTDWLVKRLGLRWGRALPMGLTRFGAAAAYLACLAADSPWSATAAFAIGFFFVDLGVSAVWAFMQDVGGRHVGGILGWGNMFGNVGAMLAPLVYNLVLGSAPAMEDWNRMFVVCAGCFVVSGLAALAIDARRPIAGSAQGTA
jgi:sugar phosphate permease